MKVISFSYWGGEKYLKGAAANAKLAAIHYPGWQLRVYATQDHQHFQNLGYQVVPRKIMRGDWEGLFWRFEPVFDPEVEVFISRDLDSRLNPKESAAVAEWLSSGKMLHVMRDHSNHNVPILGGMWGCKHWMPFHHLMLEWPHYSHKGCDQEFLAQSIWPLLRAFAIIHDTKTRVSYESQPFPIHEPMIPEVHGEFVGQAFNNPK